MAVQDILFALNGTYVPTGVYSFEYRTGAGNKITEIYFMLPPNSISWDESQRSVLQPTLTGGYLSDYGNEFKTCSIGGECHFYYIGNPKTPAKSYGNTIGAASLQILGDPGENGFLDGYVEYRKLLYMCMRYRDYTMTRTGKVIAPDFSGQALGPVNALKNHVRQAVSNGKGALANKIVTVWHDYDKDDHFLVRIGNFRSAQSADDPWTIKYTIELEAYMVDTKNAGGTRLTGASVSTTNNKKLSVQSIIDKWYKVITQTHLESAPDVRIIETPSKATITVPSYVTGETASPESVVSIPGLTI